MIRINPLDHDKLPIEYPIKTMLWIYLSRLSVFLAVVSGSLLLLALILGSISLIVAAPFPVEVMVRMGIAAGISLIPYTLMQIWVYYKNTLAGKDRSEITRESPDLEDSRLEEEDTLHRARILTILAPYLSAAQIQEALDIVWAIRDSSSRADALAALASQLAELGYPDQALTAAHAIGDRFSRASVLAELIPHLPPEEQEAALQEALVLAQRH